MEHKKAYLALIEEINKGTDLAVPSKNSDYDKLLNETYQQLIAKLKKSPIAVSMGANNTTIEADDIRQVQRVWLKYRDSSAKLFARIDPSIDENAWKRWLTKKRVEEFKDMFALWEMSD